MTYVLVVGNAVDGFRYIGPWSTPAKAADYASVFYPDAYWDVFELESPDE